MSERKKTEWLIECISTKETKKAMFDFRKKISFGICAGPKINHRRF